MQHAIIFCFIIFHNNSYVFYRGSEFQRQGEDSSFKSTDLRGIIEASKMQNQNPKLKQKQDEEGEETIHTGAGETIYLSQERPLPSKRNREENFYNKKEPPDESKEKNFFRQNRNFMFSSSFTKRYLWEEIFSTFFIFDDIKCFPIKTIIHEENKANPVETNERLEIIGCLNSAWNIRDLKIRALRNKIMLTYNELGVDLLKFIDDINKMEYWTNIEGEDLLMFDSSIKNDVQVCAPGALKDYRFFRKKRIGRNILTIKNGSKIKDLRWFGDHIIIMDNVTIESGVEIHAHTFIGPNSYIGHGSFIGYACFLESNVTIGCKVRLQSGNFILPDTRIGKVFDQKDEEKLLRNKDMRISDLYNQYSPGISVLIGSGNVFGKNCRVGCGSFFYLNNVIGDSVEFGENVNVIQKNFIVDKTRISRDSVIGMRNIVILNEKFECSLTLSFHRICIMLKNEETKIYYFGTYVSFNIHENEAIKTSESRMLAHPRFFIGTSLEFFRHCLKHYVNKCNELAANNIYEFKINYRFEKSNKEEDSDE